jgi:hypothetical protein
MLYKLYKIKTKQLFTIIACPVITFFLLSCMSITDEQENTIYRDHAELTGITEDSKGEVEGEAPEASTILAENETDADTEGIIPQIKEIAAEPSSVHISEQLSLTNEESEEQEIIESPLYIIEYHGVKAQEDTDIELILDMPDVVLKTIPEEEKEKKNVKKVIEENKKKKKQARKKKNTKVKKKIQKEIKKQELPEPVKEIIAQPGDDIEISLKKIGWIFHGYENETDAKCFSLVSKHTGYGETLFLFKAVRPCILHLRFSLQDNYSGIEQQEVVRIKVFDNAAISPGMDDAADIYTRTNVAEELYEAGNYEAALTEYLKQYQDGSYFLNDRVAELYSSLGNVEQAAFYWKKNIQGDHEYVEKALYSLLRLAMEHNKGTDIASLLHEIFRSNVVPSYSDMIKAMSVLEQMQEYGTAITFLERYLTNYADKTGKDYLYYMLAGFYERDTEQRNLKNSKFYYEKVCTEFPESPFAPRSAERITYLNRHFFFIR